MNILQLLSWALLVCHVYTAPEQIEGIKEKDFEYVRQEIYDHGHKTTATKADIPAIERLKSFLELPPPNVLAEGDLVIVDEEPQSKEIILAGNSTDAHVREKRKVRYEIETGKRYWPDNIIPYFVDEKTYPSRSVREKLRQDLDKGLAYLESVTCVKFIERSKLDSQTLRRIGHRHAVRVYAGSNCWSHSGCTHCHERNTTHDSSQALSIALKCMSETIVQHEFGHALGLTHEHTRTDSHQHIRMNLTGSMNPRAWQRKNHPQFINYAPYDLSSIQHYQNPVIIPNNPDHEWLKLGIGKLTHYDEWAINQPYCTANCGHVRCKNDGYVSNKSGRCRCVCPEGLTGTYCEHSATLAQHHCGGVINLAADGRPKRIRTPNYPKPYDRGTKCAWLVKAPKGMVVSSTINRMDIAKDYQRECKHHLQIRDNLPGQVAKQKCGLCTQLCHKSRSSTDTVVIIFDARGSGTPGRGASLVVTAQSDCSQCRDANCYVDRGGICRAKSGTIQCGFEQGLTGDCSDIFIHDGYQPSYDDKSWTEARWEIAKGIPSINERRTINSADGYFHLQSIRPFAFTRGPYEGSLRIAPYKLGMNDHRCLRFNLFMCCDGESTLYVYLAIDGNLGRPISTKRRPDTVWKSVAVNIRGFRVPEGQLAEIVIKVKHKVAAGNEASHVGIDTLSYAPGSC